MAKSHFEVVKSKDGKFAMQLKGKEGEILLYGRLNPTKHDAIHVVASVMRYGANESRFVLKESTEGMFFFRLKSPSGRILGWSEMYHSKQGRDNGIVQVRRAVQFSMICDQN